MSNKRRWGGVLSWMEKTSQGLRQKQHKVWIFSNPKSSFTLGLKHLDYIIPFSFGFNYNPITILKTIAFIKKNNIDLVVSNIKKEVIVGAIACKICKIPHVRRIGSEQDYNNKTVQRFYEKGYIHGTISPCDFLNDYFSKRFSFIKAAEMYRVYNGRNPKEFNQGEISSYKKKYRVDSSKIIIGTLSQLSEVKNVEGLVNVFNRLTKTFNNIELVIAGDGPLKAKLLNMIHEMKLTEKVKYIGFVSESQAVSSMYDIGVLFSNQEGFSNTIVEFMSVATIPICTNVGGQKEIIEDEINGYLIEPKNEEALYTKLANLISHTDLRNKISEKAIETIKHKFSENKMIDDVERIYERIIERYQTKS